MEKTKPIIVEQQFDKFAYTIQKSIMDRVQVKVIIYDEYKDKVLQGIITKLIRNIERLG